MVLVVKRVIFCMFHVMIFFTSLFGLQVESVVLDGLGSRGFACLLYHRLWSFRLGSWNDTRIIHHLFMTSILCDSKYDSDTSNRMYSCSRG